MKIGLYQQSPASAIGGVELLLALAADAHQRDNDVEIIHSSATLSAAAVSSAFHLELDRVRFRRVPPFAPPAGLSPLQRYRWLIHWERNLSGCYDVFVAFSHGPPPRCHAGRGVLHVEFPLQPLASFGNHTISPARPVTRVVAAGRSRLALLSYDVRAANSEYTRYWTERRWGISCRVVYPPAWDVIRPRPKQPMILAIGRFTQEKGQLELVRAFAQLTDLHQNGWRLCCVGSLSAKHHDQSYFAAVRSAARDVPCEIRADADRDTIREALGRSSLYWLATGYGSERPESAEHFGVATLEAMAAGCVPIVIDRGGSREIIQHGVNGFLWPNLEKLKHQTRTLARDGDLRTRMSEAARTRTADFDPKDFIRGLGIV